jgi:hypothetical protein
MRAKRRVLLQTRIARHIAFAVVVSLVLSALVLVVFRHRSVRRNMERSARTYASLISEPLTYLVGFLGSSGKGLLDQQVAQLRELNDDVELLEIVDVRGHVVLRAEGDNVVLFGDGIEPRSDRSAGHGNRWQRRLQGCGAGGQAMGRACLLAGRNIHLRQR